ncbi:hypothetical protein [Paracoccus siganidrum]|uniref:Lipoprotein n=1 Tax=Paracoccus siganidrum TaxID=1276757 RepID=A0A418ZZ12_9RHOB|nr:hypothetical protein [Paracoccus siganidrum]RJL05778.1 hypothetical protein D3P05_19065 [Paracoccus siganidrum]RMC31146.1 hypothetical protein C9E82_16685 [Paracoccus siganidrum]
MIRGIVALVIALTVAGCTETVDPQGTTATRPADFTRVAYDEVAEARKLTNICVKAEFEGVNALAPLTQDGYQYIRGGGDAVFLKEAPKSQMLEFVRSIGVRKKNERLSCTIHVRPYTRGAGILAAARAELLQQGWTQIPAGRGKADWFTKDGRTVSVLGWVPGGQARYATGAEISFSKVTN